MVYKNDMDKFPLSSFVQFNNNESDNIVIMMRLHIRMDYIC